MIFFNPAGAPELACEHCGCRWFDRMTNTCYQCGAEVTPQMEEEFKAALEAFALQQKGDQPENKTDSKPDNRPAP